MDFLTDDPDAWLVRVGEHNMFQDEEKHVDIKPVKILFPPNRDREYTHYCQVTYINFLSLGRLMAAL